MSKNTTTVRTGGIGFLGLLTILFIGLKLTGYTKWSWWFVLLPLYLPPALFFGIVLIIFVCYMVVAVIDELSKRK